MPHREIDQEFLDLPLQVLADAALSRARELGVSHADLRVERHRTQHLRLRDASLEGRLDDVDTGFAVRVVHEGTWGFAAAVDLTPEEAVRVTEQAVAIAKATRPANREPVELADEPVYPDARWVSSYDINPFDVPDSEKVALLAERSARLLASDGIDHVDASVAQVLEHKFYADLAGTTTRQQRVRLMPTSDRRLRRRRHRAVRDDGEHCAAGRSRLGVRDRNRLGLGSGDRRDPRSARRKDEGTLGRGRQLRPGHRSVEPVADHPRIDRTRDRTRPRAGLRGGVRRHQLRDLRQARVRSSYGSPHMHVTGDRTAEYGLSTIGFDDDGVAGQQWDLIRDGILVGYQLDRRMAKLKDLGRSNGCAFADAPDRVPLQRMANVSLQPAANGPSTEELIAGVERGIYIVGDKSWSIDMQRYNFQFTGQRFYEIRSGHLSGQLRDIAYQATTTDFWGSMDAVGGPQTYVLGGAFNCGKAQPGQVAPVSHGCPSAVFRGVKILNTVQEGGR